MGFPEEGHTRTDDQGTCAMTSATRRRFAEPYGFEECLIAATERGDVTEVDSLFRQRASDELAGEQRHHLLARLLEVALRGANSELVSFLWQRGVTTCGKWQESPLGIASSCKSPSLVRLLLQLGADPNAPTQAADGLTITPIIRALKNCDNETLEILLRAGANPNVVCEDFSFHRAPTERCTPLLIAQVSRNWVGKQLLLDFGAKSELAETLGMSAKRFRPLDSIRAAYVDPGLSLLRRIEKRDVTSAFFERRLSHVRDLDFDDGALIRGAANAKRHDLLQLLLEYGANPNKLGGSTLADLDGGDGTVAQLILDAGYQVNEQESGNPLLEACRSSKPRVVELLLQRGAWPDGPRFLDPLDVTPLMETIWRGDLRSAALLLNNGADPNLEAGGFAPFDYYHEEPQRLRRWLLHNERPSDVSTHVALTPLMLAAATGEEEIERLLLEHGADKEVLDCSEQWAADYKKLWPPRTRQARRSGPATNQEHRR